MKREVHMSIKKVPFSFQFSIFLFTALTIFSCNETRHTKLTIATSANMKFAMEEMIRFFEKDTGIKCEMIVGSSGKLTAQIKEHAPFDVFVSANMMYPEELHRLGYASGEPKIYAFGHLILLSMQKNIHPDIEDLDSGIIKHVALANPKTAPYGKAAMEVIKRKGLLSKLEDKMVFGENIAQVNQFVHSGVAEVGFTARSVIRAPKIRDEAYWTEIDPSLYTPIAQGIVILNNRKAHLKDAGVFLNYLLSAKGKEILNKFGYSENR